MAFRDSPTQPDAVNLLQRSLQRGRLGHAYLFTGSELAPLENAAANLAKTLLCEDPPKNNGDIHPQDCCDLCLSCGKVDRQNHPDVQWIRPESKLRVITIQQIRDLLKTVHLKPTQGRFKLAVVAAADRLNTEAANAFLKTLEEPPPDSILILLSTDPQHLLETILSRCLRLHFAGETSLYQQEGFLQWLSQFASTAVRGSQGILARYRLLSVLLHRLGEIKSSIQESLNAKSPLERYDDADPKMKEKWEVELTAAIEAEYRHQRADLLTGLTWWLRDVWLASQNLHQGLLAFPQFADQSQSVAQRLSPREALGNLHEWEKTQRLLQTNVQEGLILEVGLLKLKL